MPISSTEGPLAKWPAIVISVQALCDIYRIAYAYCVQDGRDSCDD